MLGKKLEQNTHARAWVNILPLHRCPCLLRGKFYGGNGWTTVAVAEMLVHKCVWSLPCYPSVSFFLSLSLTHTHFLPNEGGEVRATLFNFSLPFSSLLAADSLHLPLSLFGGTTHRQAQHLSCTWKRFLQFFFCFFFINQICYLLPAELSPSCWLRQAWKGPLKSGRTHQVSWINESKKGDVGHPVIEITMTHGREKILPTRFGSNLFLP